MDEAVDPMKTIAIVLTLALVTLPGVAAVDAPAPAPALHAEAALPCPGGLVGDICDAVHEICETLIGTCPQ